MNPLGSEALHRDLFELQANRVLTQGQRELISKRLRDHLGALLEEADRGIASGDATALFSRAKLLEYDLRRTQMSGSPGELSHLGDRVNVIQKHLRDFIAGTYKVAPLIERPDLEEISGVRLFLAYCGHTSQADFAEVVCAIEAALDYLALSGRHIVYVLESSYDKGESVSRDWWQGYAERINRALVLTRLGLSPVNNLIPFMSCLMRALSRRRIDVIVEECSFEAADLLARSYGSLDQAYRSARLTGTPDEIVEAAFQKFKAFADAQLARDRDLISQIKNVLEIRPNGAAVTARGYGHRLSLSRALGEGNLKAWEFMPESGAPRRQNRFIDNLLRTPSLTIGELAPQHRQWILESVLEDRIANSMDNVQTFLRPRQAPVPLSFLQQGKIIDGILVRGGVSLVHEYLDAPHTPPTRRADVIHAVIQAHRQDLADLLTSFIHQPTLQWVALRDHYGSETAFA